jgi:RNA polymerase sigma factor (sigma-70 family)
MAAVSGESDIASAVVGARSGDESAVAVLFQHFQPRLLRYLNARIPGSADDIASETWLAVAERIGNFEGSAGEFAAWIFAIARNRVADNYRRQSRRPRTVPLASEEEDLDAGIPEPLRLNMNLPRALSTRYRHRRRSIAW